MEHKLTNYWGPDRVTRSPQEHYEYLMKCSKLWKELGADEQAFKVRLMAGQILNWHRGEFTGSYTAY